MSRIPIVPADQLGQAERDVFAKQVERWGVELQPYQIYARRPSVLHAVVGMWNGLKSSGLLDTRLTTLLNRRVAALNGCVF